MPHPKRRLDRAWELSTECADLKLAMKEARKQRREQLFQLLKDNSKAADAEDRELEASKAEWQANQMRNNWSKTTDGQQN